MPRRRPFRLLAAIAAAGVLTVLPATAAWADTVVELRQSEVFADDPEFDGGFGECEEKPDQDANEDIWVFVWPGNSAGDLVSLLLNFDSDGDGVADSTRTEADATPTTDSGTLKVWVTTPAGWQLIDGTSVITGTVPGAAASLFNLTHSCAGEPAPPTTPPPSDPPASDPPASDPPASDPPGEEPGDNGSLPVTGAAVTGAVVLGAGLVAGGIALLTIRRRRDLSDLIEG